MRAGALLRESPVEHPCVSEVLKNHGRNYTRFLKTAKIKLFLAHTIAGYNRRTVHQWLRLQKLAVDRAPVKTRRKARTGRRRRYEDLSTTTATTNADP